MPYLKTRLPNYQEIDTFLKNNNIGLISNAHIEDVRNFIEPIHLEITNFLKVSNFNIIGGWTPRYPKGFGAALHSHSNTNEQEYSDYLLIIVIDTNGYPANILYKENEIIETLPMFNGDVIMVSNLSSYHGIEATQADFRGLSVRIMLD